MCLAAGVGGGDRDTGLGRLLRGQGLWWGMLGLAGKAIGKEISAQHQE